MNNRKVNIIIGIISAVAAVVTIFVLFATCFGPSNSVMGYPSSFGSCFDVMFGAHGYSGVPALVTAFVLQIVAAVFLLIGAILPGKLGTFGLGIGALAIVVAGVLWFMAPNLFLSINKVNPDAEQVVAGVGNILTGVFCLVSGLLGAYGAYRAFKA